MPNSGLSGNLSRRDMLRLSTGAALATVASGDLHASNPYCAEFQSSPPNAYTGIGSLCAPLPAAFRRVTLEVSLKPFTTLTRTAISEVCREIFRSWAPLLRRSDGCAVMLWSADGSEILDYAGRMEDTFDWARYLGGANPPPTPPADDPNRLGTHARNWLYMTDPPRMTYGSLRMIVALLKQIGQEMTGNPVEIGATFDPGGEFAYSDFKFHRHPEISTGDTRGPHSWVNCIAKLHGDTRRYAAYPDGIPNGLSFGTFFGRQSQSFLGDLGFDYIWFSNGFGFALSPWNVTGPLFNGERFESSDAPALRSAILSFWTEFRAGCPKFPIETRGTNITVGADLAANGSPVRSIYRDVPGVIAPPNSPWAAINGDVGLEIIGYLSRIAELPPDNIYPFRFYTHDPWWLNSPWLDRYGREPYDIYLPLALARIDGDASVTPPAYLEFLTIDSSYGRMPEQVPNEVTPDILWAMATYSDAPGLVTWIYPFDEYHDLTFGASPRLEDVFFGDWFLRDAVNTGFPVNSVISTRHFMTACAKNPQFLSDTILLVYAPVANGDLERLLIERMHHGQRVLLYGPIDHTGQEFRRLLNLDQATPVSGKLRVKLQLDADSIAHGVMPEDFVHRDVISAGAIDTVLASPSVNGLLVCATVSTGGTQRVAAISRREPSGPASGTLAWVRGSFCCTIESGQQLPVTDNPSQLFPIQTLMRLILAEFGYSIRFDKPYPETRCPLVLVSRHENGFFLSCYSPDTTVSVHLRFPHGAPLMVGTETWVANGCSTYTPPRSWHKEVRCLVDQKESSVVSCVEGISEYPFIERRLVLTGLKNATVHFYPENHRKVFMAMNDMRAYNHGSLPYAVEDAGKRLVATAISGELLISW